MRKGTSPPLRRHHHRHPPFFLSDLSLNATLPFREHDSILLTPFMAKSNQRYLLRVGTLTVDPTWPSH